MEQALKTVTLWMYPNFIMWEIANEFILNCAPRLWRRELRSPVTLTVELAMLL